MKDKTTSFSKASTKCMTYANVIDQLNNITKTSGTNKAYFSTELNNPEFGPAVGFKFSSAEQSMNLGVLMRQLGFSFVRHYTTLEPYVGELHLMPEHANQAKKLFNNWCSWEIIEKKHENDAKWKEIVGIAR
ncbi:MAG: hypothetical protein R8N50_04130 [Alphaproteobacteria bacterium]|nr:hypothetical protein [Alphaproteobacteria bacterium]